MTVERILNNKGRNVVTVEPNRTIGETSKTLTDKKIGAVVVTDTTGAVVGILSERDIVRAVARGGPAALDHPVSDYMSSRVVSAVESMSIDAIMGEMTSGRFRHLPVVQNGRLHGIVSIGDIVKYRLADIEHDNKVLHEYIASA